MFGSDPPSVNTALLNSNRESANRMSQFGENLVNEYDGFRQEMQSYTTDLMQNVVGMQMQAFQEQLGQSTELFDMAKSDRDYYESTWRPVEEAAKRDAMQWDSADKIKEARAGAAADVDDSFDAAKRNQRAQLEGYGVDPSMTRHQALDRSVDVAKAAAQAGAMNKAANDRQLQAAGMRSNLLPQANATANRALSTAGTAANASGNAARTGALTTGTANQTVGSNNQGYAQSGAMADTVAQNYLDQNRDYNAQYQNELGEYNSTLQPGELVAGLGSSVIGGMAGAGAFNPIVAAGMKKVGMAEGGVVPTPEQAGVAPVNPATVQGGVPTEDRTPTALTPGEFVIPDDTVRWKGQEYFHKEIQKAREAMAQGGSQAIPAGAAA